MSKSNLVVPVELKARISEGEFQIDAEALDTALDSLPKPPEGMCWYFFSNWEHNEITDNYDITTIAKLRPIIEIED